MSIMLRITLLCSLALAASCSLRNMFMQAITSSDKPPDSAEEDAAVTEIKAKIERKCGGWYFPAACEEGKVCFLSTERFLDEENRCAEYFLESAEGQAIMHHRGCRASMVEARATMYNDPGKWRLQAVCPHGTTIP